jgi:hypothetical protein
MSIYTKAKGSREAPESIKQMVHPKSRPTSQNF